MEYSNVIKARLNELIDQCSGISGLFPQRSKIRLERVIENGKGQYRFSLKADDAENKANGVTTFALKRDDVFVPSAIGFLIELSHVVNGTVVRQLYSFAPKNDGVNPSVFAAGFKNDSIENLYQGNVQWTVGSTVAWEAYAMENFKKVFRQQGAFVLDSNDAAVQEGIQPEYDIQKMLEMLYTKYLIAGTQDHVMTVNFDAANLTFPVTDGYTAKLVLYMDGFLIKNGTKLVDQSGTSPFKGAAWSI